MKEKLNTMPLRDVTLRQLNVVEAIAKTGKISLAANTLGVTPPAVTAQLKLLEQALGLQLFDRTPRGLRLTDAGQYMLAAQARIAAVLSECNESVLQMRGLSRGRLLIGAVSTAKYFTPRFIAAFLKTCPGVHVEMFVGNQDQTVEALEQFKLDIAIMGRPPERIEVEHHVIGPNPHVIIAEPAHRLVSKRRIALDALTSETFLYREPGSGTRSLMERTFAMAQFAPKAVTEFGSNETIKQAVMAGLGIAFISVHTVASEIEAGRLTILKVQGFPVLKQWHAVRARDKSLSPAGGAMWNFLIESGDKFLPEI